MQSTKSTALTRHLRALARLAGIGLFGLACGSALGQGELLLKSGFEEGVRVTEDMSRLTGADRETGFDWAGTRGTANIRKNSGFHLVGVGRDLVVDAPADAFQNIRVYKRGGAMRLMVDDVIAAAYDDDGQTYGPVWNHAGWIGLRQMAHTVRCEYDHVKVFPLKPLPGETLKANAP